MAEREHNLMITKSDESDVWGRGPQNMENVFLFTDVEQYSNVIMTKSLQWLG